VHARRQRFLLAPALSLLSPKLRLTGLVRAESRPLGFLLQLDPCHEGLRGGAFRPLGLLKGIGLVRVPQRPQAL
jgi:hypothetical protein